MSTVFNQPLASTPPAGETVSLKYSVTQDYASPLALDGATVSGVIFVFSSPDEGGITDITFYLDDPSHQGAPHNFDAVAPYDFNGSS